MKTKAIYFLLSLFLLFSCEENESPEPEKEKDTYKVGLSFSASWENVQFDPDVVNKKVYVIWVNDFMGSNQEYASPGLYDSLAITINGLPMEVDESFNNKSFKLLADSGFYVPGENLKVELSHPDWGNYEFDWMVADEPVQPQSKPFTTNPAVDELPAIFSDGDTSNDAFSVTVDEMLYCNKYEGHIQTGGFSDFKTYRGKATDNIIEFNPEDDTDGWEDFITLFESTEQARLGLTMSNKQVMLWEEYALILTDFESCSYTYTIAETPDVAGNYKLTTFYTATNSQFSATFTNKVQYITINQEGADLTLAGIPAATGKVNGDNFWLTGDILEADATGGEQQFEGTMYTNGISGNFSGTIWVTFDGETALSDISQANFTLEKMP